MSAADCCLERAAVSFTGGKDCVLAMHLYGSGMQLLPTELPEQPPRLTWSPADTQAALSRIRLLITFAPPNAQFKAHPLPVIRAQARALQLPHKLCEVNSENPLESYKQHLRQLHQQHGITKLITGDILDIAGGFMRKACEGTGVVLVTPLWQQDRCLLLQSVLDLGIQAVVSCVNLTKYGHQQQCAAAQPYPASGALSISQQQTAAAVTATSAYSILGASQKQKQQQHLWAAIDDENACAARFNVTDVLLGQTITSELIKGPLTTAEKLFGCDLCGEYGEYHTLVTAAPMFKKLLSLRFSCLKICDRNTFGYVVWDCENTNV